MAIQGKTGLGRLPRFCLNIHQARDSEGHRLFWRLISAVLGCMDGRPLSWKKISDSG